MNRICVARQRVSRQQRAARRLYFRRAELPAMPGTAGHGSGAYSITVEMPDVATLPQNSPVMVDDVTVGSVSGIAAEQWSEGTFYAEVKLALDKNVVLPGNAIAKVAQTSLLGSLHIDLAPPHRAQPRRAGWANGREFAESNTGRFPDH